MKEFHLEIVTPDGTVFNGPAKSLLVRTCDGDVEIMAGHADFFAPVGIGVAKVVYENETRAASAAGGVVSVKDKVVRLVCTTFEYADSIDVKRAEKAKERAEEAIRAAKNDAALRVAKAKLARAISRINAADLK